MTPRRQPISPIRVPSKKQIPTKLFLFAWLMFSHCLSVAEGATQRTVTTTTDGGAGSLRQLIVDSSDGDSINFGVTGVIVLTNGELVIGHSLTIAGPGAKQLVINGNNRSRVFNMTTGLVQISGLAITGGRIEGLPEGFQGLQGIGGGIYNAGTLVLSNCVIATNQAIGGLSGSCEGHAGNGLGGGIYNMGVLTLWNCTITHNSAQGATANPCCSGMCLGGNGSGGGIYTAGTLTAFNSTVEGNTAAGSSASFGGHGEGGGIEALVLAPQTFSLINCTLANNAAVNGSPRVQFQPPELGGGLVMNSSSTGTNITWNTLIARNVASTSSRDISGTFTSIGHNLVGTTNGSSGWAASDLTGSVAAPLDPLLGSLQDNGGQLPTMSLPPASPAVNAGDDAVLGPQWKVLLDQRGEQRRSGAHADIGAFEYQWPAPYLFGLSRAANGTIRFSFSNNNGVAYNVAAVTNLSVSASNWSVLGLPTVQGGGLYQFTDPDATNFAQRFYQLRSP